MPTFQFFPDSVAGLADKTPREREVARAQGYIEPQPFLDVFRFVAERDYEKGRVLQLPKSAKRTRRRSNWLVSRTRSRRLLSSPFANFGSKGDMRL